MKNDAGSLNVGYEILKRCASFTGTRHVLETHLQLFPYEQLPLSAQFLQ